MANLHQSPSRTEISNLKNKGEDRSKLKNMCLKWNGKMVKNGTRVLLETVSYTVRSGASEYRTAIYHSYQNLATTIAS